MKTILPTIIAGLIAQGALAESCNCEKPPLFDHTPHTLHINMYDEHGTSQTQLGFDVNAPRLKQMTFKNGNCEACCDRIKAIGKGPIAWKVHGWSCEVTK